MAACYGIWPPWPLWSACAGGRGGFAGGGRLEGAPGVEPREHAVALLGGVFGLSFAIDSMANHQNDVLIAALVLGGCLLWQGGRWIGGAAVVGLAAGLKCTPLLFAPYLAWRRSWLAAGTLVAVAIGGNLLPDLVVRPANVQPRLARFVRSLLMPMADKDWQIGMWAASIEFNHSLAGTSNRLLAWERHTPPHVTTPRADPGGPATPRGVFLLAAGLCVALSCLAALSQKQDLVAECALVLALMLLLSPHSSKGHFCTLIVPGFFLARRAVYDKDRVARMCIGIVVALTVLKTGSLVGKSVSVWLFWYGVIPAGTVVLLLGCAWARWRGTVSTVPQTIEVPLPRAA